MAAAANFLLSQNFDDVRSIKGKVMNISSPYVLYGYIRWHKLGWYWFSTISEKQDGHHSQFSADSEFWRRPINERKSHEYIITKLLYADIRWHKLGWYWFSAISKKKDGRHSQFFTNIVWPITAIPFKLSYLTCRWVIIILCCFLEWSNWNKMAALTKLENYADSIFTMSDQLKEKLWIYHHHNFYMRYIRWHKLGWY